MSVGDVMWMTACGLYVVDSGEPRGWANFSWQTKAVDLPGDGEVDPALRMIELELMEQFSDASGEIEIPSGIWFGALHDGQLEGPQWEAMRFADPEVPPGMVEADTGQASWTVCGILETSRRPCCVWIDADTAPVAYFYAWRRMLGEAGEHMLLCGIHGGEVASRI